LALAPLLLGDERSRWESTSLGLMSASGDMGEGEIEGEVKSEEDRFMVMSRLGAETTGADSPGLNL
jgi:hypothetical protein